MKIQFCSDLHLEFADNTEYLRQNPIIPSAEYLILAGDISYLNRIMKEDKWFFDWCSNNYEKTWIIPGNHEFYGGTDISILEEPFIESINPNVWIINNKCLSLGNYEILFTPLLSRISDPDNKIIKLCMNDFRRIFFHGNKFIIDDYNSLNHNCLSFLEKAIGEGTKPKIIISHHVPSNVCNSLKQRLSPLNEAFTNNLDDFIKIHNSKILYWIYGHSHKNSETRLGNTVLFNNALGYVHENEQTGFNRSCFLELK